MKLNIYRSYSFLLLLLMVGSNAAMAQLPSSSYFYYHSGTTIYNYNTTTGVSTVNTIALPFSASGFAVNNNFFAASPSMTFYTTVSGTYWYYNGTSWVNTTHSTGNSSAVNIGGAGPYIYNLNGVGDQIYKYTGTGPGTLFLSIPGWGGPFDVTGDAVGNVYIMNTSTVPYNLKQYNSAGLLVATYSLVGFPTSTAGGGFVFINGKLYATIGSTHVWGTISGTTITYGGPLSLSVSPSDYANWPLPVVPLPVELVSFQGAYNDGSRMNDLEWVTATEINNESFTVQYSEDAVNWMVVGTLEGAGNSNTSQTYHISHDSPYASTYYRLTQKDYDGNMQAFDPIRIDQPTTGNGMDCSFILYPNPAINTITLETDYDQPYQLEITDEAGRLLVQEVVAGKQHMVDIGRLEAGLYFVTTQMNEVKRTTKLIKN